MKKYGMSILIAIIILVATQSASGISVIKSAKVASDIKLEVFGQPVETEIISVEKVGANGTTNYVSARDLAQYLGYDVKWNGKSKTISVGLFPTDGNEITSDQYDQILQFKQDIKPAIDEFTGKFSTREWDNLNKSMTYLLYAFDGDVALLTLLMADDYQGYTSGKEAAFSDIWISLENAKK